MLSLVAAADLARFSYWVVVAGAGVVGAIMAYLLLPSRLKVLGNPTVRFTHHVPRDEAPLGLSPLARGGASSSERSSDPGREARERTARRIHYSKDPNQRDERDDGSE